MRIGVDLGGTKIEIIALDDRGAPLLRRRVPNPAGDYSGTVRAIAELVRSAQAQIGVFASVGIATPGALSPQTGLLRNSNSVVLNGKPLDRDLADALGQPVRLENDANCLAISEATDGAGAGSRVVFAAIFGTGVGGGIVIEGRILTGLNRIGGEWGHNPLPWATENERPGYRCYCGKFGCIETFLSGAGLAREYFSLSQKELPAEQIAEAEQSGEPDAVKSIAAYQGQARTKLGGARKHIGSRYNRCRGRHLEHKLAIRRAYRFDRAARIFRWDQSKGRSGCPRQLQRRQRSGLAVADQQTLEDADPYEEIVRLEERIEELAAKA